MTYLDAAYTILKAAGQPLHYEAITQKALEQGLIKPQGATPAATMGSRLYTDTLEEGSRFVRAGRGTFGLAEWRPKGIDAHVSDINADTRKQLREMVLNMPPDRFEALIRELLIRMGFDESTVQITPYRSDGGVDVIGVYRAAGLTEVNAAVQVKRWQKNVNVDVVTQLRGSLQVHQQGIIITTSDFTKGARQEAVAANKTRIGLINGDELIDLLVKHQVGVVKRTLDVAVLDDEYWSEFIGQSSTPSVPNVPFPDPVASRPVPTVEAKLMPVKPKGFILFGEFYAANTWRRVLLDVCQALARRCNNFAMVATTIKGRSRQHIADSPKGMISPAPIPGTTLWIETNQNAQSVLRIIEQLPKALGRPPSDFEIVVN